MGYLPYLSEEFREGSEEQMARELLKLTSTLQGKLLGAKIDGERVKNLQLTKERKYDMLIGQRENGG